jgi:hypothetical protein
MQDASGVHAADVDMASVRGDSDSGGEIKPRAVVRNIVCQLIALLVETENLL